MAAPRIKLADAFPVDKHVKTSPAWCIAVWRLDYPISFDRQTFKSVNGAIAADGAQLRGKNPLIIVSDATSVTINSTKAAHTHSISATLKNNAKVNYLSEILPGDWIGVWMVNYEDDLKKVLKALRKGDPANWYDSGFKGIGRVDSLFKDIVVDSRGNIVSDYALTATCFSELDTQIYYEQALSQAADKDIPTWMAKIGLDLQDLFVSNSKDGVLEDNIHKVIPGLFEIMLGKGASDAINTGDGDVNTSTGGATLTENAIRGEAEKAAPYAYLVPTAVGRTLNRVSRGGANDKVMAFADIMTLLVGRQEFDADGSNSKAQRFYPTLPTSTYNQTYKDTGNVMLGAFLPMQVGFVNTPLWSIAQQFLNPACNEMFTSFKADQDGFIIPTVQVRQIPFTTSKFPGLDSPYGVAKFLDQPRWVMDAHLLKRCRVGRSNATRTNFVRIYGQSQHHAGVVVAVQAVENGTINDPIDIQRSGLHPYATMVACETVSQSNGNPSHWMKLVADRMMGSHLTLSGQMTSVGIAEPVNIGDNLEFDGIVYHIEAITHTCSISNKIKSFFTSFSLSNGLSSQENSGTGQGNGGSSTSEPARAFKKSNDYVLYAGINESDAREREGGLKEDTYFDTSVDDDGSSDLNGTPVTGEYDGGT